MKIQTLSLGFLGTNCYVVSDEETQTGVIIDPAGECQKIQNAILAAGIKPAAICLTHGHFDHVMAVPELAEYYHIPVYGNKKDESYVLHPESAPAGHYPHQQAFSYDRDLKQGDKLIFGGIEFTVLETPGHTPGSICLYEEKEKVLFSGDTLFRETYGRTDLGDGDFRTLQNSILNQLFLLPEEVRILPGHMEETTIGHEKRYNPICS